MPYDEELTPYMGKWEKWDLVRNQSKAIAEVPIQLTDEDNEKILNLSTFNLQALILFSLLGCF